VDPYLSVVNGWFSYNRNVVERKMKKDLMGILCCPVCKGDLELKVEKEEGDEVIEGSLRCKECEFDYPITDSIPNLLPPEMQERE
jgi:uncharacterized protein YbaR (Trm112 family)